MRSGKGLYISSAAAAVPEHNFVGIEIAKKYAALCAAKLVRRDLANGVMIADDGLRFFREWLQDASVAAVHVYFPDPWWKKRHRKRRIFTAGFVADVIRVLAPGGWFLIRTDVEEYFGVMQDLIRAHAELVPREVPAPFDQPRTNFERK